MPDDYSPVSDGHGNRTSSTAAPIYKARSWQYYRKGRRSLALPSPPRERRGGTAPQARPGGLFFSGRLSVFELLAHFLEQLPLFAREAGESLLVDLVEYAVERVGLYVTRPSCGGRYRRAA